MKIQLYFLIAILFVGCATVEEAKSPEVSYSTNNQAYSHEISTITLPISIDMKPIFAEMNKSVPVEYKGKETVCEGVSYDYTFKRNDIQFKGSAEGLKYKIPSSYGIRLNYCPKCTDLFNSEGNCVVPRVYASCGVDESPRRVEFEYLTKLKVENSFSLKSTTELVGFRSIDPCKITVFNYNATEQVEDEVRAVLLKSAKEIDAEIAALEVQKDLLIARKMLDQPIDLGTYGKLYLNPIDVAISPLKFKGDQLNLELNLSSYPSLGIAKPAMQKKMAKSEKDGFNISLPIRISFDTLSNILQDQLGKFQFDYKRKKIIIDSIVVFGGNGDALSFKLKFSGSKKGTLYLFARPELNVETQEFKLRDIEWTLSSKDVILKSIKWLFDGKIEEKIAQSSIIDLSQNVSTIQSLLDKYLNGELMEGIALETKLTDFQVLGIQIAEGSITTDVQFNGKAKMKLTVAP